MKKMADEETVQQKQREAKVQTEELLKTATARETRSSKLEGTKSAAEMTPAKITVPPAGSRSSSPVKPPSSERKTKTPGSSRKDALGKEQNANRGGAKDHRSSVKERLEGKMQKPIGEVK